MTTLITLTVLAWLVVTVSLAYAQDRLRRQRAMDQAEAATSVRELMIRLERLEDYTKDATLDQGRRLTNLERAIRHD